MKIVSVELTPILIAYKKPYHWSQGVTQGAELILVAVTADDGLVGYGESSASQSATAIEALLDRMVPFVLDRSPFEPGPIMAEAYQGIIAALGTGSAPRFFGQAAAGLEMALWDLMGKAAGEPVHHMLGGALRAENSFFGFVQGDGPEELAADAKALVDQGCQVIYVKIGRGNDLDLAIVRAVRAAIGDRRLRLDANEAWDPLTAIRMIRKLEAFDPEFIEQPTPSGSLAALKQVKDSVGVAIAADQLVFTPEDVYDVCRQQAADVIVLGLHETGGITRFKKAAAIAEAAGIRICLHGVFESGITTCASHAVGLTVANLDDGNQYMNHLLAEDIVSAPDLALREGRLPVFDGPGLGFTLDRAAVARAAAAFQENRRR